MQGSEVNLISAELSHEFEIRLESKPSTGYIWQVGPSPEGLMLLGDAYEQIPPQTVGGPVNQVFRFRASAKGSHAVTFVLKRTWEPNPIETRRFIVVVD